jgi:hypothetical protein
LRGVVEADSSARAATIRRASIQEACDSLERTFPDLAARVKCGYEAVALGNSAGVAP